jgi:HEAT repeat protein
MRSYSANREEELENALRNSSDPLQRRASARLLGYANRSAGQIESLTEATRDPDQEVRNNATRALSALASATNSRG